MPIPSVAITVADGALGIIADDTTADSFKLGVSSAGTVGTLYSYRGADTSKVRTELGQGPLVEAISHHLKKSGGKTVYAMKLTSSVVGTNTAVTQSGGGPLVTLTGAPLDQYDGIAVVVAGGALGVGTFKFSLDGGETYSVELTIPAGGTYLMPDSGVTLNFAAGTYVAATTYSWTSEAPSYSNADLSTGLDSVLAINTAKGGFIHVVGQAADASGAATMATTLQAKLVAAAALKKYMRGIIEMPAVDKALLITAFAAFSGDRVGAVLGFLEQVSDVSGRIYKRSLGHAFAARLAKVPISVDAIRNDTDSNIESLPGVVKLVPDGAAASTGYHDEGTTPGADAARFITAMTIPGVPGFYICNPNLMAAPGSDFKWLQYGRVMDRACEVVNLAATKYLSKRLRLDPVTGFILKAEATAIEADIGAQVRAALVQPSHAVSASVVVNRADNLLSSPVLRMKVRIVPFPHAKTIECELAFLNPALV
jgi:hypothetical protein